MTILTYSRPYSTASGYKVEAIAFQNTATAHAWAIQQRDNLTAKGNEHLRPAVMRSNSKPDKVLEMIFKEASFVPNWGKPSKKEAFEAFTANPPIFGVFVTL